MLRNLFGPGDSGTTSAYLENKANDDRANSNGRAGARAASQGRSIGARSTHTAAGSLQARAAGRTPPASRA